MIYEADDHAFVVCAYKKNPYIKETIESLLAQTVPSRVVLSTSTPSDYLSDICQQYDIPMLINPRPHHAGDDWNYGYNHVEARLVTLAHQDDYYDSHYVERILYALNHYANDDISIVYSDYFEIRNEGYVDSNTLLRVKRMMNTPFRFGIFNSRRFFKRIVLAFGCPICCPAVTLVKSNVGMSPFDTHYINSCDYKTWVDLANQPGRFVYIPDRLVGHRIYAGSATSKNIGDNIRRKEDEEILRAFWPRSVARFINRVYAMSEKSNEQ